MPKREYDVSNSNSFSLKLQRTQTVSAFEDLDYTKMLSSLIKVFTVRMEIKYVLTA